MSKKRLSRVAAEHAEDMPSQTSEVPENRLQGEQQLASTDSAQSTTAEQVPFVPKRSGAKGSELKQQVISEAITGSGANPGMGINAAGRHVSGTAGGILGANNGTPEAGQSRGKTRVEKKLDRVATKLNYTPAEQVIIQVDEAKPLADAADQDQGYNGTYRNENARSQKIAGAVPGDLMFERSVDLITKDQLYFVEGQMCFQDGDDNTSYNPSHTLVDMGGNDFQKKNTAYHTGNFLHRGFHFGVGTDGKVRYFYADVEDISTNGLSAEDANMASAARLIKSNVAELDRMSMDAKAGDEKADLWTPLARAIDEPTKASFLMSSIEAATGAYVYLAYAKASTNMSFQLNRAPKDGLDTLLPAIEQMMGWRKPLCNNLEFRVDGEVESLEDCFDRDYYRIGDPSLMIKLYDSVAKYNTKADLLLQPRGWRMHLQTADNNINPLRVPGLFANVYAATEVFSTIDHDYDPLMPICMTDKANLIIPHNLNELAGFYKNAGAQFVSFTCTYDTTASYTGTNVKIVEANVPARMGWPKVVIAARYLSEETGDGLDYDSTNHIVFVKSHSPAGSVDIEVELVVRPTDLTDEELELGWVEVADIDAANVTFDINFKAPTVEASKISKYHGTYANKDWDYYQGGTYTYSYSDLRNNYIVEVKHPLIHGIIAYIEEQIGTKLRSELNQEDFYMPLIFSTQYMTLAQLFICAATPWIARVRLNSMKDVIYYQDNVGSYPYSKLSAIKEVPFKNYANFNFSDYDHPLETKIMNPVQAVRWVMPEFFWKVADLKYVLPWYFNECDLQADGSVDDDASTMSMPSIRSGVRLGLLDSLYGMTEKDIRLSLDRMTKTFLRNEDVYAYGAYKYGRTTDGQIFSYLKSDHIYSLTEILSCPRELGLLMDAPLGVLTADPSDYDAVHDTYPLKAFTADGTATSFCIKLWVNNNSLLHPTILAASGVNITRAANFTQKWFAIYANNVTSNTDVAGLVFGMGDDTHVFKPFASLNDGSVHANGVNVNSYQRSVNTRLQFLPFVISPFDGNFTGDVPHDIYDVAYFFGLCGFRASDYRESVYNRQKEVINLGLTFTDDPWVNASPIISGAAKGTGVSLTRGYELK